MGTGWGQLTLGSLGDPDAYALEVTDHALGTTAPSDAVIVVSPAAPVREGDTVLAGTPAGTLLLGVLRARSGRRISLAGLDDAGTGDFGPGEVAWMHRVVWNSR